MSSTWTSSPTTLTSPSPRSSAFRFHDPPTRTSSEIHDADYIPSMHPYRTLVLCFDGTGDSFDADNSNVVHFFSMLKKDDFREQMVYYQAGIGTYTFPEIATPGMAKLSKTLDMMIAWNMNSHVMDGYTFLMQNYTHGDKVCLFGFSRGAYTARALAGMLHKVGLLPADNHQQLPFAYRMYTMTDETGWKQSTAFKKAFCRDVDIEFIGVWDTVSSVGLIPHRLPFTASNSVIKTFRHAIALDERRAKFKANLFNRPTHKEHSLGTKAGEMPKAGVGLKTNSKKGRSDKPLRKDTEIMEQEFTLQEGTRQQTDVMEVWFAGCHTDVGGGSVANDSRHNLARIPLRWMIRQCFLTNSGVRFHTELLKTIGLDPTSLYPEVKPRPPAIVSPSELCRPATPESDVTKIGYACLPTAVIMTEEEEDLADSLCRIYDQLRDRPAWWILEFIPVKERLQQDDNTWKKKTIINRGRGREIPVIEDRPLLFHRSVKIRMDCLREGKEKYRPKAKYHVEPIYVD